MNSPNPLPLFVIGLQSRATRYRACLQRFDDIGLRPEFFEGVDGSKYIPLQAGEKLGLIRRGTAGCALAHYRLWKHALGKGLDRIAVFEDDALPHPHLNAFLAEIATFDDEVEYINIASPFWCYDERFDKLFSLSLKSIENGKVLYTPHLTTSTRAYVVNRRGMEKLVKHAMPIWWAIDVYIGNYYTHALRSYGVNCHYLVRNGGETDSIIHACDQVFTDGSRIAGQFKRSPLKYILTRAILVYRRKTILWRRRLYVLRHAREFFAPNAFPSRVAMVQHVIKSVVIVW